MFAPRDISLVIISSIIFILQKKETIQKKRRSFVFIISFFFTRGAPRLWRGSCVDVSFTHINFYFSASWLGPLRLFVPNVEQNTKSRLNLLYEHFSRPRCRYRSTHLFVSYQPLYFITLFVRKRMYKWSDMCIGNSYFVGNSYVKVFNNIVAWFHHKHTRYFLI